MLEDVVGHVDRVFEVPPGVDVDEFRFQARDEALAELLVARRGATAPNPGNASERLPDEGNAARLAEFLAGDEPTVVYFGKLIEKKGVQLLLEAMQHIDARARDRRLRRLPRRARARSRRRARSSPARSSTATSCTCCRWPTSTVVPSIFPEAFGMVAAEAAAAGSPPLVARHSGLAEVAAGLEEELPERLRHLVSFERGDAADLRRKLEAILALPRRRPRRAAQLGAPSRRAALVVGRRRRAACSRPSAA